MHELIESIAWWIEVAGVGVMVVGGIIATVDAAAALVRRTPRLDVYNHYRRSIGRAILLGLEFLVAGDIIGTILVDQSLESVGVLAVVVLIRTFLSFSLETEIEGSLPWRRTQR